MPKLSVIVPVYNVKKYLIECLNSILSQTFTDFELILVNDGSTDNCGEICDKYASQDSRVVVIHKENGGLSSARNSGLEYASGKYITFIDSDDYYTNEHIYEQCITKLEQNNEIDFIQISHIHVERVTNNTEMLLESIEDIYIQWIKNKFITNYAWDKIYRKQIFEKLRYPIGQNYEDRYVFPQIIKLTKKCYISPWGYYYYRQHTDQITRKTISESVIIDQIKADQNILKNLPKNLNEIYCIVFYRMLSNYMYLLKFENKNMDIPMFEINLLKLIFTPCKYGIKIRLAILKILGLKIYCKIFK